MHTRINIDAEYGKKGYLKEDYRVFYIKDICRQQFDFHYHEFDKIVLFRGGNASYIIEGKEYSLTPNDILLVNSGDIHKPVISNDEPYERIIIWINSNYLKNNRLYACFEKAKETGYNLLRLSEGESNKIFALAEKFCKEDDSAFAGELMKDCIFLQLIIEINRRIADYSGVPDNYRSDIQTDKIIEYINKNLFSELTVGKIADEFYLSRYYLMHKFKRITGKTIYGYIISKRLIHSAALITSGVSAKAACFESGFKDYSVFLKAFKKEFECTPTEYIKREKV